MLFAHAWQVTSVRLLIADLSVSSVQNVPRNKHVSTQNVLIPALVSVVLVPGVKSSTIAHCARVDQVRQETHSAAVMIYHVSIRDFINLLILNLLVKYC